jgi:hypothetical protein
VSEKKANTGYVILATAPSRKLAIIGTSKHTPFATTETAELYAATLKKRKPGLQLLVLPIERI